MNVKKQKGRNKPGGFPINIFIQHDGKVVITTLCATLIPLAYSLNPDEPRIKGFYETLKGNDNKGVKIKISGAFIANLAENIIEMSKDNKDWSLDDTLLLIKESYAGFYNSQMSKEKKLGFNI